MGDPYPTWAPTGNEPDPETTCAIVAVLQYPPEPAITDVYQLYGGDGEPLADGVGNPLYSLNP
jgi:hypothetical protein